MLKIVYRAVKVIILTHVQRPVGCKDRHICGLDALDRSHHICFCFKQYACKALSSLQANVVRKAAVKL